MILAHTLARDAMTGFIDDYIKVFEEQVEGLAGRFEA